MTDTGMRGRVKGLLAGAAGVEPTEQPAVPSEPVTPHQALQVLTLAQRTADDHVASARRHADTIRADAQTKAEQIVREAHARARVLQEEAEKALADAHAEAARVAREAQAQANNARRNAEALLSDARTRADELGSLAQERAEELNHQAQLRYDEVVGSLAAKREALQRQIEALEQFDRDYRSRLTTFMQNQLRALWVDEPRLDGDDLESPEQESVVIPLPTQAAREARG